MVGVVLAELMDPASRWPCRVPMPEATRPLPFPHLQRDPGPLSGETRVLTRARALCEGQTVCSVTAAPDRQTTVGTAVS